MKEKLDNARRHRARALVAPAHFGRLGFDISKKEVSLWLISMSRLKT